MSRLKGFFSRFKKKAGENFFAAGTPAFPIPRYLEKKKYRYDPQMALTLARFAQWAYPENHCYSRDYSNREEFLLDITKKKEQARALGFKQVDYVFSEETNILVFIVRRGRKVILCFRGTVVNNFINWSTDFNAQGVPMEDFGNVHKGFSRALETVWQELRDKLGPLKKYRLWLTGHSLGGALALLAAARLAVEYPEHYGKALRGIYIFGAPRVGDGGFRRAFKKKFLHHRCFAFANHNDVITVVPPFVKRIMGYRDVGHILFFNWKRKLKRKRELSELKTLRAFLAGYFNEQVLAGFNLEKISNDWNTFKRYFRKGFTQLKLSRSATAKESEQWRRFKQFFTRELPMLEPKPAKNKPGRRQGRPRLFKMIIDLFIELFVELNPYVFASHDIATYIANIEKHASGGPPGAKGRRPLDPRLEHDGRESLNL